MYKDQGGATEVIQGITCHLPPVGWIYDPLAGDTYVNGKPKGAWVNDKVHRRKDHYREPLICA